jgi:predicted RNA-binding Zn ribbon-like protein
VYICVKLSNIKMKSIALDPGNYSGTYKLVGEEISFDFINTISWPGTEREHDWLDVPGNFILWATAAGIISKSKAKLLSRISGVKLTKEMEYVQSIRYELSKILTPLAFDKKPPEGAIADLNILIHQIVQQRSIDLKTQKWVWNDFLSLREVLAPIIWNAGHVITEIDHARIKHCPSCNWIFYDNTKNKSRRWCDMKDCGSRDKSLRYYHSQK